METELVDRLKEASTRLRQRASAGDSELSELMSAVALALEALQVMGAKVSAPPLEISPDT
jgi:hypothetical protein